MPAIREDFNHNISRYSVYMVYLATSTGYSFESLGIADTAV